MVALTANIEEELFLVVYFDPSADDGKIHVRNRLFAVRQPVRANAEGLFECFTRALDYVNIVNWKDKLVGFGCDGANVNIGANGLRGFLEEHAPWIVMFWCLAHRLELSLQDALKSTLFSTIDEMLLHLYFLYEKSPKKCRDLDEIVQSLKECLEFTNETPTSRAKGNRPLRACGTRFVNHKVVAISRLIEKYGAYIAHLVALTEDKSIKSVDRQKLKGYILKWRDSKIILGCAVFHDLLKPCASLSKSLQDSELSIIDAIEAILKTSKAIERLKTTSFDELPTVKKVLSRIQDTDDGMVYQGAVIVRYPEAITYLRSQKTKFMESVLECLKDRIRIQHSELLTHILTVLATYGWNRSDDGFADIAIDNLSERFKVPLEKAEVDVSALQEEWMDMVRYAQQYLNLVQESAHTIWWKLFNSSLSKNWTNILSLIELLFCLPVSNGRVERVFSSLKHIKSNCRTCLSENRLDDLIRIAVEGPPLSQWDATGAVHLWWKDKQRRNIGDTRAPPR